MLAGASKLRSIVITMRDGRERTCKVYTYEIFQLELPNRRTIAITGHLRVRDCPSGMGCSHMVLL